MRIVRLANFVAPNSGGLRTALHRLGAGYLAAGHEPVLVIPGANDCDEQTTQGRVITVRGALVPGSGGYRLLVGRRRLRELLAGIEPDRLKVSDRSTLRWTGAWAREHSGSTTRCATTSTRTRRRWPWHIPSARCDPPGRRC